MVKLYVCEISKLIEEVKEDATVLDTYSDKLGKERMAHILKNSKAEDRACSLGAALLLLFALKEEKPEIEVLPDFDYIENGKPYFEQFPSVHFNLSHTKNMVICGISDMEIGVDIEHIRDIKENTINKVFTDKEKKMAKGEREGYIRLWTMKEACAKLSGRGLADILDGMEIVEANSGTKVEKLNQDIRKASCVHIVAEGKLFDSMNCPYLYSVCAQNPCEIKVAHTKWENSNIMLCH